MAASPVCPSAICKAISSISNQYASVLIELVPESTTCISTQVVVTAHQLVNASPPLSPRHTTSR
jgi:hypothetical protein